MIFIQGNFPSFKNSKQYTGRYFVVSATVTRYLKHWEWQFECPLLQSDWMDEIRDKSMPYMVGMHFVRGTRHKYDWINMCQGVQDLMVKHGWLEDDNTNIMFPVPLEINGEYSTYDKDNPGVYIQCS